jgi:hypothetical protein
VSERQKSGKDKNKKLHIWHNSEKRAGWIFGGTLVVAIIRLWLFLFSFFSLSLPQASAIALPRTTGFIESATMGRQPVRYVRFRFVCVELDPLRGGRPLLDLRFDSLPVPSRPSSF